MRTMVNQLCTGAAGLFSALPAAQTNLVAAVATRQPDWTSTVFPSLSRSSA